jgi:dGTPase
LSEPVLQEHHELKRFLRTKLYNHPRVREVMDEAKNSLKKLFETYLVNPSLLPAEHYALASRAEAEGANAGRARVVADYVAGMTYRFAILEQDRLKTMSLC